MLNYMSLYNLSYFSHQFILFLCVFIFIFVLVIFFYIYFTSSLNTIFSSHFLLEYFWTLFPVFLVLLLFLPLFYFNSINSESVHLYYFIVANQWFWDFSNFESIDSFWIDINYINGISAFIPSLLNLNFFFTSNDVLHAFSLPILYTMIDLVPGVIHNLNLFFPFIGVYTVYCAQICGAGHATMPMYLLTF